MVEPTGSNPQTVKGTSALITVGTIHNPIFNCNKDTFCAFSGGNVFFYGKSEDIAPFFDLGNILFTDATA